MNLSKSNRAIALAVAGTLCLAVSMPQAPAAIEDPELKSRVGRAIDRGLKWLRGQQQDDGSWEHHPGITALVLTAYARSPRAYREDDGPFIREGVRFLESKAKPDGSIYDRDLPVYNTAVSVMALCALGDPRHAPLIESARDYMVDRQTDEGEGYEPTDKFYGGIGYGNDERPDLSNLQFALEGLHAAALDKDDPAWQRAIAFLERCQNRSESNDQEWAANDGGFVYAPGLSMAGETKSYGSMTYAGIKSFIYADLERDDPRVQEALDWIRQHYTLDENPKMGAQGLYYYYNTFAKALRVVGEPSLTDADGREHVWAEELAGVLLARQSDEGHWVNEESGRWWEGNKTLVTAEAILALEETLADLGPAVDRCPALSAASAGGRQAGPGD
jgi:squalene-hopene/tetraprenyl-beta-curcumene cyclase